MLQHFVERSVQGEGNTDINCKETSVRESPVALRAKRMFDLGLGILLLPLFSTAMTIIAFALKLTSKGPVLYWSNRVGRNNGIFRMPKFRTMKMDAPEVATHLLRDPKAHLTTIGAFLEN